MYCIIVKPGITQDEVEQLIQTDNTSSLFADQILNDPRHAAARSALVAIQQQNRDIKQLERSMNELQQMFLDMATLVDVQGDQLEQIGRNVNQAVVQAGVSVSALEVAERNNKARKRVRTPNPLDRLPIFLPHLTSFFFSKAPCFLRRFWHCTANHCRVGSRCRVDQRLGLSLAV